MLTILVNNKSAHARVIEPTMLTMRVKVEKDANCLAGPWPWRSRPRLGAYFRGGASTLRPPVCAAADQPGLLLKRQACGAVSASQFEESCACLVVARHAPWWRVAWLPQDWWGGGRFPGGLEIATLAAPKPEQIKLRGCLDVSQRGAIALLTSRPRVLCQNACARCS